MRWNQSDRKVLTILAIVGVLLYALLTLTRNPAPFRNRIPA
jgi:hypothetical protein